jgi:fibronectin type 3 domain-containing protein
VQTSYTDSAVTGGTAYFYKVSASNLAGEGARSNELSATPAGVPGAPTLNSATPGNGSVDVAWSAPSSNGGSAITGYDLYRSTSSGTETLYQALGVVTSYHDTGVSNGTTYFYKVSAVNTNGEGALSNERSATPATVPAAPTLNSATPGSGQVTLNWTAGANGGSAITGYNIYRSTSSGTEALLTSVGVQTSYTDSAVTGGTAYFYKVSASNLAGEGALSNELSATPTVVSSSVPGAPTLTAKASNGFFSRGTIKLTWTIPASNGSPITSYKIYRSTSPGTEVYLTTVVGGSTTSYTDLFLNSGATYYYKVTAVNGNGEGPKSNEASATAR